MHLNCTFLWLFYWNALGKGELTLSVTKSASMTQSAVTKNTEITREPQCSHPPLIPA